MLCQRNNGVEIIDLMNVCQFLYYPDFFLNNKGLQNLYFFFWETECIGVYIYIFQLTFHLIGKVIYLELFNEGLIHLVLPHWCF